MRDASPQGNSNLQIMIAFTKLAESLHISRTKLAQIRDERLSSTDWKIGEDGKQYFTEEGADKVRLALDIPAAVPKKIRVKVLQRAPNPHWVYAKKEGDFRKILVAVRPSWCDRLVGKFITVDIIEDSKGITYRHEALGLK